MDLICKRLARLVLGVLLIDHRLRLGEKLRGLCP
jgi:hypothetical protein